MAKALSHLSFWGSDAMNPPIAASKIAGPRVLAGAVAYMITARKMNASATDLLVWLVPSALVTGTIKRLDTTVSATRATNGAIPLKANSGR